MMIGSPSGRCHVAFLACALILLFPAGAVCVTAAAHAGVNEFPGDPRSGVAALIARVFPAAAARFQLELLPMSAPDAPAAMQLDANHSAGTVILRGTGGVELASAFNWYLNDYLNATYDWNTYGEGQLPASPVLSTGMHDGAEPGEGTVAAVPLPLPITSAIKPRQVPYSYYLNVCTYGKILFCWFGVTKGSVRTRRVLLRLTTLLCRCTGYSLAFVPWEYWQKHIDWMAMNGMWIVITAPSEWPMFQPSHRCTPASATGLTRLCCSAR